MRVIKALICMLLIVLMSNITCIGFAADETILFSEDFSDGLSKWSITGGDIDKVSITSQVTGNMLFLNQLKAKGTLLAVSNENFADFAMQSDFIPAGGQYYGWYFRYTSAYSTYLLQYTPNKTFDLLKGTGASFETIKSVPVTVELNKVHTIIISVFEDEIKVFLNDDEILSEKDSTYASGKIGFRTLSADLYIGSIFVASKLEALENVYTKMAMESQSEKSNPNANEVLLFENFESGARGWNVAQNMDAFGHEIYDGSGKLKFRDFSNMLKPGIIVTGDAKWTDYRVEMELSPINSKYMGIIFHYKNTGNYYMLQFYGTSNVKLLRKTNNSMFEVLASSKCSLKKDEANNLEISLKGNNITVELNDQELINRSYHGYHEGKIGIRGMNSMFYIDNVKVVGL